MRPRRTDPPALPPLLPEEHTTEMVRSVYLPPAGRAPARPLMRPLRTDPPALPPPLPDAKAETYQAFPMNLHVFRGHEWRLVWSMFQVAICITCTSQTARCGRTRPGLQRQCSSCMFHLPGALRYRAACSCRRQCPLFHGGAARCCIQGVHDLPAPASCRSTSQMGRCERTRRSPPAMPSVPRRSYEMPAARRCCWRRHAVPMRRRWRQKTMP